VGKRYGALVALDDASLVVRPGTVHAVLGENGAGKTTLMHVAYGMVRPDSGRMCVAGRELRVTSPLAAIAAGIGMVHQHFTLVPAMTVQENLALGGHGRLRSRDMTERVRDIAKRTGFDLDPFARVDALSVGAQQRVEIAKALARNAALLILDEPTAVLAPAEVDDLLRWLRAYAAAGNAAVLITHKLREALDVADDVTVLRRGQVVFAERASVTSPQLLADAMIGGTAVAVTRTEHARSNEPGRVVFEAQRLSVTGLDGRVRIRDASFSVRAGDLVGIVAVEGAGQHELLRALAGRMGATNGQMMRPVLIGFVPEDRHQDAVLLDRSIAENVALRDAGSRRGFLSWNKIHARTMALMRAFDVRASSTRMPLRFLSGGNQQRLVLARELAFTPGSIVEGLVVENPTRGLDVRATADVHHRLREACAGGAAVIFYSNDLDEVLSLASRVLVLFDGVVRELPLDRDAVGRAMLGLR
jgi:ABC-type uncharacterized transport system ATPase subunit